MKSHSFIWALVASFASLSSLADVPANLWKGTAYDGYSGCVAYHLRPQTHDLLPEDWRRHMDFADLRMKRRFRAGGSRVASGAAVR